MKSLIIYTCISKNKSLQWLKKTKPAIFIFAWLPGRQWDFGYMDNLVRWLPSIPHVPSEHTEHKGMAIAAGEHQQAHPFSPSLRACFSSVFPSGAFRLCPCSLLCLQMWQGPLSRWESPEPTPLFSDTLHARKWGAICSSLLALGRTSWWQGDFCLLWYALYHFYLHFNSPI